MEETNYQQKPTAVVEGVIAADGKSSFLDCLLFWHDRPTELYRAYRFDGVEQGDWSPS